MGAASDGRSLLITAFSVIANRPGANPESAPRNPGQLTIWYGPRAAPPWARTTQVNRDSSWSSVH